MKRRSFLGYLVLNISGKTLWLLIGSILSMLIGFVLEFLFMNLDYARTERVQFEDDDYYYYVKAVPKKMVASKEVTVKHFGNTANILTLNISPSATMCQCAARLCARCECRAVSTTLPR